MKGGQGWCTDRVYRVGFGGNDIDIDLLRGLPRCRDCGAHGCTNVCCSKFVRKARRGLLSVGDRGVGTLVVNVCGSSFMLGGDLLLNPILRGS